MKSIPLALLTLFVVHCFVSGDDGDDSSDGYQQGEMSESGSGGLTASLEDAPEPSTVHEPKDDEYWGDGTVILHVRSSDVVLIIPEW